MYSFEKWLLYSDSVVALAEGILLISQEPFMSSLDRLQRRQRQESFVTSLPLPHRDQCSAPLLSLSWYPLISVYSKDFAKIVKIAYSLSLISAIYKYVICLLAD